MDRWLTVFWLGVVFAVVGVAGILYSNNASDPMWTEQTQVQLLSLQSNVNLFYFFMFIGFTIIIGYFVNVLRRYFHSTAYTKHNKAYEEHT